MLSEEQCLIQRGDLMTAIRLKSTGDYSKITQFLEGAKKVLHMKSIYEKYGEMGVKALQEATPKDTGLTASMWRYEVSESGNRVTLSFHNDNRNKGVNIALILQYGHGTGTGGWVEGRDYINPAIQPIFDELAEKIWKETTDV